MRNQPHTTDDEMNEARDEYSVLPGCLTALFMLDHHKVPFLVWGWKASYRNAGPIDRADAGLDQGQQPERAGGDADFGMIARVRHWIGRPTRFKVLPQRASYACRSGDPFRFAPEASTPTYRPYMSEKTKPQIAHAIARSVAGTVPIMPLHTAVSHASAPPSPYVAAMDLLARLELSWLG
jgi:hypothetical protein